MSALLQDLRYGVRVLARSPGFSLAAIVTLTLAIGANTAIFSVVNAIVLRPLPLVQPDGLVVCVSTQARRNITRGTVPYPDYLDWKAERDIFQSVALYTDPPFDLAGDGTPERVQAAAVTEDFFTVLSAPPLLGRAFLAEDHRPGAGKVVIVSESLWQRRFGGDPNVIGRVVRLSGDQYTVVGVMPAAARWPTEAALWVPLTFGKTPPAEVMRRDNFAWRAIARLRADVSLPEARARVDVIAQRIAGEYPDIRSGTGANLLPVCEFVVPGIVRRALWVLMGAVMLVLLIACANVASLMVARSVERSQEMAIRAALGAGRSRLLRLVLAEGMLLALAGGLLGLLLAAWGTDWLLILAPDDIPRLHETGMDWHVAVCSLTLSAVTAVLFALLPGLQASRPKVHRCLKEAWRTSASTPGRPSLRSCLIVAEIASSLILLVGASLLAKSLVQMLRADPEFPTDRLLTFRLSLPRAGDPGQSAQPARFYERALEHLQALPGVKSAAAASVLPLAGGDYTHRAFVAEGAATPPAGPEYIAAWNTVTPDYFSTLGIPLLAGRVFTDEDQAHSTPVIIINEELARLMFPGENPIGKRIWTWRAGGDCREVVGVVRNVSFYDVTDRDRPLVYAPHRQDARTSMLLAVRTAGDPLALAGSVRSAIWSLDRDLAVADLATMEQASDGFLSRSRFVVLLATGFALVALALALVGVYGVTSYAVNRRKHEFGVRMALGAQSSNVLGLVVKQAVVLTVAGVAIGLLAAAALAPVLSSLLYDVSALDPGTFVGAAVLLSAAALAAACFPARRAAKLDPMTALRCE